MNAVFNNLETHVSKGVQRACQTVLIICPFVKIQTLHRIIGARADGVSVTIISSWKLENFVAGASDAQLFPYCADHNFSLLANNRVHLKAWLFDRDTLILGSANITDSGLTDGANSNHEFVIVSKVSQAELVHFDSILGESVAVSASIYDHTMDVLGRHQSAQEQYEDLLPSSDSNVALVDQIPLTPSPEDLWTEYAASTVHACSLACIHDLERLHVPSALSRDSFFVTIENEFFSLPIVSRFLERLVESPLYFGESKALLQKLNESDPKPTRRDLTAVTQNLFRWLQDLAPSRFAVDCPHQSQRLTMMS